MPYEMNDSLGTLTLVMAMAPIDEVISSILEDDFNHLDMFSIQEKFASIVDSQWNADKGPSKRYLRVLIKQFVKRVDENSFAIESDLLSKYLFQASLKADNLPNAEDSCYLSFELSRHRSDSDQGQPKAPTSLMRLRIYPQHNDVALRLWEAGAFLAEYIMEHPTEVSGKHIIELGAGIGCTAIVAAYLKATSVLATDYTAACLENLQHNIDTNKELLQKSCSSCQLRQGYLEWSLFSEETQERPGSSGTILNDNVYDEILKDFYSADVLLAADVCYDISVIESLVLVMRNFLQESPAKYALFAITKRNMATFDTFLSHLTTYHMQFEWILRGADCEKVPLFFPCNFVQDRADICIARLVYKKR